MPGERGEEWRLVGCDRARRLLQAAADEDDEERGQQPQRKQQPPGDVGRCIGEHEGREQHSCAPPHGPGALHRAQRLAAMLGANDLGHQHRAASPFGAEAEALNRLQDQELVVSHRERAGEGRERKGRNGNLKRLDAAKAVAERAAEPAAERAEEQRDRAEQARIGLADAEGGDQRGNGKAEHLDVERIQRPAAKACPERAPLQRRAFAVPV